MNKIHLTVHATWTSFSPSTDIAKRNWAPRLSLLGSWLTRPEDNFVKKNKNKNKKTKTFVLCKM